MAKKSARKAHKKGTVIDLRKIKPVHGMAAGGLLTAIEALVGISILTGLTILVVSALVHLLKVNKAK